MSELLHEQHARAPRRRHLHQLEHALHHQRRQPQRELVGQKQLRFRSDRPRQGQDLLFAARQIARLPIRERRQLGTDFERLVERHPCQAEVVPHRQRPDDAALLRQVRQARVSSGMERRGPLLIEDLDLTAASDDTG